MPTLLPEFQVTVFICIVSTVGFKDMGTGTVLLLPEPMEAAGLQSRNGHTDCGAGRCLSSLTESLAHSLFRKDHEAGKEGCIFSQQVADGIWSKWLLVCPDAINNRIVPLFQNVPSPPWAQAQPQRTTNSLRHSFCHPSRMKNLGRKTTKPWHISYT